MPVMDVYETCEILTFQEPIQAEIILLRISGRLDLPEAGGPIIGKGNIVPFKPGVTVLEPDNRLYLHTDGIVEYANDKDEFYNEERLYEELIQQRFASLDESCENLFEALRKFSGDRKAQDDMSLLALMLGTNNNQR